MQYHSTYRQSPSVSLKDAIVQSSPADGGLYMPYPLPQIPKAVFNNISEMSISEIAYLVCNSLFNTDLSSPEIMRICEETFNFEMPLIKIEDNIYVYELFHGPTMGVKDIGSRFLARALSALHPTLGSPLNVLVATNGNSGNAVANGFHGVKGVNVFTIYPAGIPSSRVAHFTSLGDNVYPVRVLGTIDDCRAMVDGAASDKKFNEQVHFTCANSTNIGRVLPQTVCFFHAYAQLIGQNLPVQDICISVPSGNGGDLLAGYVAKLMGLPINKLVAACNANGAFVRYYEGKEDANKLQSIKTLAYGMDTSVLSNASRFTYLSDGNKDKLKESIDAVSYNDKQIKDTIVKVYNSTGYVLDPHGAVSYLGLKECKSPNATGILFATAHPCRSKDLIEDLLGKTLTSEYIPPRVQAAYAHEVTLAPTYPALRKYIKRVVESK